ncbi:MAG: imidazole glycerol phosphate synthase subunit HisH [Eggerthellaceae bacterium]|nr:imidazole glycerol phosphate synthase subunit HisH [Eggerthellaceae bacterium]
MNVAIVDYGVGNLFSLTCSFSAIGKNVCVTSDPEVLRAADAVVLPGVGAFGDAIDALRKTGLDKVVCEIAAEGKPLLGICLGMQMLFDKSYEYGEHEGLGLIPGEVRSLKEVVEPDTLVPHIGWNALHLVSGEGVCEKGLDEPGGPLLSEVGEGAYVYFVHSFYATDCVAHTIALTDYDVPVTAAVQKDNVFGCQFHPEKSGQVGLAILTSFCNLVKEA